MNAPQLNMTMESAQASEAWNKAHLAALRKQGSKLTLRHNSCQRGPNAVCQSRDEIQAAHHKLPLVLWTGLTSRICSARLQLQAHNLFAPPIECAGKFLEGRPYMKDCFSFEPRSELSTQHLCFEKVWPGSILHAGIKDKIHSGCDGTRCRQIAVQCTHGGHKDCAGERFAAMIRALMQVVAAYLGRWPGR